MPLVVAGSILAAVLVFLLVFYVPADHAEVVGSTRYSDAEIRKMVLNNFADHNSLYLSFVKKTVVPKDAPFVKSIDIEYKAPGSVQLNVNENTPIGYIEQDGRDFYFDTDGVVLEAIDVEGWTGEDQADESVKADSAGESVGSSSVSSSSDEDETKGTPLVDLNGDGIYDTTQAGIYLIDTDGDGYPDQTTAGEKLIDTDGDGIPDASPYVPTPTPEPTSAVSSSGSENVENNPYAGSSAEEGTNADGSNAGESGNAVQAVSSTSGALQAVMENSSDTEFHPALTDVTEVTGLTDEKLSVGSTIQVEDKSIFLTLQALSKIISKLDIKPDSIELDSSYNMTLHYGETSCMIGNDNLLEEKMSRVAAILPQIRGMKGTLHLENFSEDTVNIIFDKG